MDKKMADRMAANYIKDPQHWPDVSKLYEDTPPKPVKRPPEPGSLDEWMPVILLMAFYALLFSGFFDGLFG